MDKHKLVNLCSRTWSLTALGLMGNGISPRVSPLAAAAGCGRTSMGASVEHLVQLGLLERNPGHGHPLRPEYRLTYEGESLADWASQLTSFTRSESDKVLLRHKWCLPLISCLPEEKRYSDIRRALVPVTDRALSHCLSHLTESAWVKRNVSNSVSPPAVTYRPMRFGQKIHNHLMKLQKVA